MLSSLASDAMATAPSKYPITRRQPVHCPKFCGLTIDACSVLFIPLHCTAFLQKGQP